MSPNPVGRPPKYAAVLGLLEDVNLYTSATIVTFAEQQGFFDSDSEHFFIEKKRMRIALIRHAGRLGFPRLGDGLIRTKGQPYHAAWFGWRWKARLRNTMIQRP